MSDWLVWYLGFVVGCVGIFYVALIVRHYRRRRKERLFIAELRRRQDAAH